MMLEVSRSYQNKKKIIIQYHKIVFTFDFETQTKVQQNIFTIHRNAKVAASNGGLKKQTFFFLLYGSLVENIRTKYTLSRLVFLVEDYRI